MIFAAIAVAHVGSGNMPPNGDGHYGRIGDGKAINE